jgi:putative colanic acid biosynthesis UDP-glucose lipid carrier transferase
MFRKGLLREHSGILVLVTRFLDVTCVFLGGLFAYFLKFGNKAIPLHYQIAVLLALLLTIILFSYSNIYKSWRGQAWLRQARILVFAWLSVVMLLVIIAYATKTSTLFSRQWMVEWSFLTLVLLMLFRFSLSHALRIMRANGLNKRRIVIIGAGVIGRRVATALLRTEWAGYEILGFFDDKPGLEGERIVGIKVHSSMEKLREITERGHIDEVWVALPLSAEERLKEILYDLRHSTASIRFVPDIFGLQLINHSIAEVAGLPVLNITESPMQGLNRFIKYLEDKLIAALILLLISPFMLILAIGVKLSSPGPVFYRQERVSWNGKSFMMLKFRSMPVNCEVETGAVWATAGECRATRFGSFLRRTSLDELPQFINVLMGNMSIVGPRPERPFFVERFKEEVPGYMKKHMVKAGITGWAQVNGWRGDTDLEKRIEYDLYYIENWSLWFDLKIIFKTLFTGFVNKNAY